jgi:hypothetical protein
VLPEVWQYCERHIASGLSWGYIYPLKLLELWAALNQLKPQTIVELGAGCTTAVFRHYANLQNCRLWTVEENPKFYDKVSSLLPECAGHEVLIAPSEFSGLTCRYALDYRQHWLWGIDFLYVDGPSNQLPDGETAVCRDATLMLNDGVSLGCAMFDIRKSSVRDFREQYGRQYNLEYGVHFDGNAPWYLSGIKHHTTARRLV